jgi:uncharacterized membrane-anchored protein
MRPQTACAQLTPGEAAAKEAGYVFSIDGPRRMPLPGGAILTIPAGYTFADADAARVALEGHGRPHSGDMLLMSADDHWNSRLSYTEDGHVRDTDAIDPNWLFRQISAEVARRNSSSAASGAPVGRPVRWVSPPHYDSKSHRLEWSLLRDFGAAGQQATYVSVIFTRLGYWTFVSYSDTSLDQLRATLLPVVRGFEITPGNRYQDFRPGDRVAGYGLLSLMGAPPDR